MKKLSLKKILSTLCLMITISACSSLNLFNKKKYVANPPVGEVCTMFIDSEDIYTYCTVINKGFDHDQQFLDYVFSKPYAKYISQVDAKKRVFKPSVVQLNKYKCMPAGFFYDMVNYIDRLKNQLND